MKLTEAQVRLLREIARWNEVRLSFKNSHTFYALARMGLITTASRDARLAFPLSAEVAQIVADVEPVFYYVTFDQVPYDQKRFRDREDAWKHYHRVVARLCKYGANRESRFMVRDTTQAAQS